MNERLSDRVARMERLITTQSNEITALRSSLAGKSVRPMTEGWAKIKAATGDANVFTAVMLDIFDKTTAATPVERSASANIKVHTVNGAAAPAVGDVVKVSLSKGIWTVIPTGIDPETLFIGSREHTDKSGATTGSVADVNLDVKASATIPQKYNDDTVFSGTTFRKAGTYAYNVSWSLFLDGLPPEDGSIGPFLTNVVEFSYDGSGHVDGIRNGSFEDTLNPSVHYHSFPIFIFRVFLIDGGNPTKDSDNGLILSEEEVKPPVLNMWKSTGTDSGSNSYSISPWEDGSIDKTLEGALCGGFSVDEAKIAALNDGFNLVLEVERLAIGSGSSTFTWKWAYGCNVVRSPIPWADGIADSDIPVYTPAETP